MKKTKLKTNEVSENKKINRREFFKLGGTGVAAAALTVLGLKTDAKAQNLSLKGKKYAMVIDRVRCTGCGGCIIACKNENNVQAGVAWAYKKSETTGKFPNVKYDFYVTLCNHCEKAPCVKMCPTAAMHKIDGDITMHDPVKCIGCKSCIAACPYGVITRNNRETHKFWRSNEALIRGCTESPKEVAKKARGDVIPYYNPDREKNIKGSGLRYKGIVEKCTFCDHRLKAGKLPYCVLRCPAKARIFGDLNDPDSAVNKLLAKYKPTRLKEYLGTEPKVFYVRDFNPANYKMTYGSV